MAKNLSKAEGLTPIVTFVSMIILGVIISQFVVQNPALELPIILFSFILGIIVAVLEYRAILGKKRIRERIATPSNLTPEERERKLSRYVADLFEEDIPFDEIEAEKKRKIAEIKGEDLESLEESEEVESVSDIVNKEIVEEGLDLEEGN